MWGCTAGYLIVSNCDNIISCIPRGSFIKVFQDKCLELRKRPFNTGGEIQDNLWVDFLGDLGGKGWIFFRPRKQGGIFVLCLTNRLFCMHEVGLYFFGESTIWFTPVLNSHSLKQHSRLKNIVKIYWAAWKKGFHFILTLSIQMQSWIS